MQTTPSLELHHRDIRGYREFLLPESVYWVIGRLNYVWTLAYLTPGGQSPYIWTAKCNTFCKGKYLGKSFGDVIKTSSNNSDKRKFVSPGQTIISTTKKRCQLLGVCDVSR